jgi:hypothetical protein
LQVDGLVGMDMLMKAWSGLKRKICKFWFKAV